MGGVPKYSRRERAAIAVWAERRVVEVWMEGGEGGRASDIRGLDINQGPGAATVEVEDDDVRLLRQVGAMPTHPQAHRLVAAGTLGL